jgi:hypothetical protein
VARAARDPRREAARLGLLILATACAAAQEPPGGPPDVTAPALRAIRPDSGAVLPGFDDPVVFAFDEVVTERSSADMGDWFVVSPRHAEVHVAWKRTRLEVKPRGGWRDGAVYRVVLRPVVSDLRNNRMRQGAEVVFSTGPAIPDTRVDATVIDWAAHRITPRGLLEAFPLPVTDDSIAYIAQADSAGDVALTRLPPGPYLLVAVVDDNGNQRRDRREAFDTLSLRIDSTASGVFWAFARDTVGPQIRSADRVDSVTVRLTFTQRLAPTMVPDGRVTVRLLPDSTDVDVDAVWTAAGYDTVRAAEDSARRAAADTAVAADSALADTAAARDTTVRRPARAAAPPAGRPGARPGERPEEAVIADTARVAALLAQRPRLADQLVVRLADPLIPGARYLFEATTVNLSAATAASRTVLAVPDTAGAPGR